MTADLEAQDVIDVESEPDDPYNGVGSDLGEWDNKNEEFDDNKSIGDNSLIFLFLSKLVLELLNVTFEHKVCTSINM